MIASIRAANSHKFLSLRDEDVCCWISLRKRTLLKYTFLNFLKLNRCIIIGIATADNAKRNRGKEISLVSKNSILNEINDWLKERIAKGFKCVKGKEYIVCSIKRITTSACRHLRQRRTALIIFVTKTKKVVF